MNASPLFKTKMSNERLMTALLLVLLLYSLPRFLLVPGRLLQVLLYVAFALVLDAVTHYLKYKRPVCAVSAAVTALILSTLSPDVSIGVELIALTAALVLGKLIWGGTGKNPLNPAMVGLAVLAFIVPFRSPAFDATLLLLPAAVLSLPFLLMRPYAGAGMLLGMAAALLARHALSPASLIGSGIFFWSCLVITDPVTTTSRPVPGAVIGLAAGFVPLMMPNTAAALPLGILISNILSFQADRLGIGGTERLRKRFGSREKISFDPVKTSFVDLAGEDGAASAKTDPDCATILERVERHHVLGCGGAAFPTVSKLRAAAGCTLPARHLIINAAECDPGLIHDKWLLVHRTAEIAEGIALLRKCMPFNSVTIAAKNFYGAVFPEDVRVHRVRDWYPAGAEKILIRDVLGIGLKPDEIPSECGILVVNVQTVLSLREAAAGDTPAETRYITAADLGSRRGTVVRVRLGDAVAGTAARILPNAVNVYTGGGAMSARLSGDDAIIDEKTNFIAIGPVRGFREALCSRCDLCSASCPAGLPVRELARLMDDGKPQNAARLNAAACLECNLCSAVCPAGRDQAKRVRTVKKVKV